MYTNNFEEITRRESLLQHVEQLAHEVDWASADGKFVLFHLLAVSTWTSRPCRPDMPLSMAVAEIFESPTYELKNHHVRPLANSWANWGAAGVLRIFEAWNLTMAPRVAATALDTIPIRASRRVASISSSTQPLKMKRRRSPKRVRHRSRLDSPIGLSRRALRRSMRLPAKLAPYVVDLTT